MFCCRVLVVRVVRIRRISPSLYGIVRCFVFFCSAAFVAVLLFCCCCFLSTLRGDVAISLVFFCGVAVVVHVLCSNLIYNAWFSGMRRHSNAHITASSRQLAITIIIRITNNNCELHTHSRINTRQLHQQQQNNQRLPLQK